MDTKHIAFADKFAVSSSTLCVIHCVALPFLIGVFPAVGASFLAHESFHFWLLGLVIPSSAFALLLGCRKHKNRSILAAGTFGVAVLILAALFGHDFVGEEGERLATLFAATIIALAHIYNFKLCRSTQCAHK